METIHVIVVGGGITGMSAARRLSERLSILGRPYDITIVEASARLGGVIGSERRDAFLLEQGPDCFISEKTRGVGLCQDLGLSRELISTEEGNRRSFIAWGGKLHPTPDGFQLLGPSKIEPMLFTPLLTMSGKFRLLKEYFLASAPPEDESLASFVRRRFGSEVLERLAQPLASGIYGADPERLSLRATFPKFLEMEKRGSVIKGLSAERAKGAPAASGARYSLFMTLKDGLQSLVDRLSERLTDVKTELNSSVHGIKPFQEGERQGWRVQLQDGRTLEAEGLCLTVPAPIVSHLFRPLDSVIASHTGQIPYSDAITAHFAFPIKSIAHPMNGFGFVVPAVEKRTLAACTFVHRKFANRAPEGYALLRAYITGATAATLRSASTGEIERKLLTDLTTYLKFTGKPIFSHVSRYPQSMPQYGVGHLTRLKEIEDRVHNWRSLALAGNWRRGVGIPDCIESGEQAADALINSLCRI